MKKLRLNYKGFALCPDKEYIKDTMNVPAFSKLNWLEEANEFYYKFLSKKKRKIWESLKHA